MIIDVSMTKDEFQTIHTALYTHSMKIQRYVSKMRPDVEELPDMRLKSVIIKTLIDRVADGIVDNKMSVPMRKDELYAAHDALITREKRMRANVDEMEYLTADLVPMLSELVVISTLIDKMWELIRR